MIINCYRCKIAFDWDQSPNAIHFKVMEVVTTYGINTHSNSSKKKWGVVLCPNCAIAYNQFLKNEKDKPTEVSP
jgi:protein-arginine kinase activator protein McsA